MIDKIKPDILSTLKLSGEIADKIGVNIFLIGGFVRDLLLDIENHDIDVCIEYDAIEFANKLTEYTECEILQIQPDLKTAKVKFKEGIEIDFASTREEIYPKASYLPEIKNFCCDLIEDVKRRDFTINSIAISLNSKTFGEIKDYTNGVEDIKNKKIRILHDKSFIDDPSRIIRTIKYSSRLNFEIEAHTYNLLNKYINNFKNNICLSRILNEIKLTFNTNNIKAFEGFLKLNLYKLLGIENVGDINGNKIKNVIKKYKNVEVWEICLYCLFYNLEKETLKQTIERLNFTKKQKNILQEIHNIKENVVSNNIEIYKKFKNKTEEALCLYEILNEDKDLQIYFDELKDIKVETTGEDLLKLGLMPSPKFNEILNSILEEKINKNIITKEEEIKFIKAKYL